MDRFRTFRLFIAVSLLVGVCHCWWVSVDDSVNAVRGSCVLVPCSTVAYSKVAWYKYVSRGYPTVYSDDYSEILSEFRGRTSVPGSRYSGDCSLRIDNVQYSDSEVRPYVWVWDRDGYNQGFYDYHQIIDIYVWDPTEPEISVESKQVEGKPFTATCTFRHSCRLSPPRIYWHGASPISNTFTNTEDYDELWESKATATFIVTQNTSLRCSSSLSGTSFWSTSVFINVLYAPKNVRIDYTRSSTVDEGNTISLHCTSNSHPAVTAYEWVVTQNTTTTRYRENPLVLQNVRRDTSVSCSATNTVGTGRSQQLSLSVNYAPTDVKVDYTGSSSVLEGGQISLTCNATSRPAPTLYKWHVSPNSVTFTPNGRTVVLQHVTRDTSVSCTATNSIGQVDSKQLLLDVHYAPTDVKVDYTGNSSVLEGGQISLTCNATSRPAPTLYKWHVSPNSVTFTPNGRTVVLQHVTRDTSVSCTATNSIGQVDSKQLLLNVHYAPTDVKVDYTGSSSVLEGGQISLTCNATSRPAPTLYKWHVSPNSVTFTPNGPTVVLQHVTRDTSVFCTATNSIGQVDSKQLLLNVHYAPTDVKVLYTGSSSVVEGGQISLTCNSMSRPAPTHYEWLIFPNSTTFSHKGNTVVLQDVRRDMSVSCIANNSMGQGESKQLLLNVHYSPSILPGSVCFTRNGILTCECQADAKPNANISWTVNGRPAFFPIFNTTTQHNGSLTVSELTGPQGHNVTCTAANIVGQEFTQIPVPFEGNASALVVAGAAGGAGVCIIIIAAVAVIVRCKKRRHAEPSGDLTIAQPTKREKRCHDDHTDSDEDLYANTQQVQRAYKERVRDSSIYANYDLPF